VELARMIGAPMPEILSELEGEQQLSPMALSFFRDNKRVSNRLLHEELLPELTYPDFRAGMRVITGEGSLCSLRIGYRHD